MNCVSSKEIVAFFEEKYPDLHVEFNFQDKLTKEQGFSNDCVMPTVTLSLEFCGKLIQLDKFRFSAEELYWINDLGAESFTTISEMKALLEFSVGYIVSMLAPKIPVEPVRVAKHARGRKVGSFLTQENLTNIDRPLAENLKVTKHSENRCGLDCPLACDPNAEEKRQLALKQAIKLPPTCTGGGAFVDECCCKPFEVEVNREPLLSCGHFREQSCLCDREKFARENDYCDQSRDEVASEQAPRFVSVSDYRDTRNKNRDFAKNWVENDDDCVCRTEPNSCPSCNKD